MDTKQALISFVDVLLRVPSLFLLDEVFQSNLSDLGLYPCTLLPLHKEADFDNVSGDSNHTMSKPHHSIANYNATVFGNFSPGLVRLIEHGVSSNGLSCFDFIVYNAGYIGNIIQIGLLFLATLMSVFTLTLWTKQLVKLYEFFLSIVLATASYQCNQLVMSSLSAALSLPLWALLKQDLDLILHAKLPVLLCIVGNVAVQSVLASGYLVVSFGPSTALWQRLIAFSFLLPSLAVMLPFENSADAAMWCFLGILSLHVGAVMWFNMSLVYKEALDRLSYVASFIRTEGFMAFAETEWLRLNIPLIFRTFWLLRTAVLFAAYLSASSFESLANENWNTVGKILLVRGCETLPAILGMASIFSWIAGFVYVKCQHFLMIPDDEVSHVGPVSAVLFIILAFQNGLSSLKPAARLIRLSRNLFLLVACFFHFVHNAVDPVLMSLGASANPDGARHARALSVSGVVILVASGGMFFLWNTYSISTWLLAVTGFSVEVICKVLISLALYGLFLADAKLSEFWDKLDDYVYCVRFAGRAVEFLVGLFLLCNSAFILVYESGGAIRAILVGLHAYFNLWCEARVGWKIFTRRRTAVAKIATLETVVKMEELDDVCAICFHDLKPTSGNTNVVVKMTPCRHYFHAVCLRKWLYVQDRCPMCHQTLWPQATNTSGTEADADGHYLGGEEMQEQHLHED